MDALKRIVGKVFQALPAIVGSVVGAILSFVDKAVGVCSWTHMGCMIVFNAKLIGGIVMAKSKKVIVYQ